MVKKPANGNPAVQHKSGESKVESDGTNLNSSVESNGKGPDSLNSTSDLSFTNSELFYLHDKMASFRMELIKEINDKSERFKQDIENLLHRNSIQSNGIDKSLKKPKKDISLGKEFKHRESLLTELFKINHFRTIRHIFISILIIICFQIIIMDLTTTGRIDLDFKLFWWSFEGFQTAMLLTWLPMQLSALFVVYYGFRFWALTRLSLKSKTLFDSVFIIIYLTYLGLLITLPIIGVNQVSLACRIIILMEQVRLLMKSHAFVRSNIIRALKHTDAAEKNDSQKAKSDVCPKFQLYLYFMFAPTLVYQDEYPRTSVIRWRFVITHFIEIIGSIIYTYCLFDRFCVPVFRELKVKELNYKQYIRLVTVCIMPGALMQLMIFFSFLHCWHNAWAEMMRFGDRQFYLDWWNATSYNAYYRTWNTLVQDWLYTYIYRDLYLAFGKRYRAMCQFMVIFISSIFHEHILSFAFGFFYPVMFILFSGFGFVCLFIPSRNNAPWNIFIWTSLFTGLGIQICLFGIEWYARETSQCPRTIHSWWDYFLPRSIMC